MINKENLSSDLTNLANVFRKRKTSRQLYGTCNPCNSMIRKLILEYFYKTIKRDENKRQNKFIKAAKACTF